MNSVALCIVLSDEFKIALNAHHKLFSQSNTENRVSFQPLLCFSYVISKTIGGEVVLILQNRFAVIFYDPLWRCFIGVLVICLFH